MTRAFIRSLSLRVFAIGSILSTYSGCDWEKVEGELSRATPVLEDLEKREVPLLHATMASTAFSIAEAKWRHLPVPSADGPQLWPVTMAAVIRSEPGPEAEKIGYLRVGERVGRSLEPVEYQGCPGGWYAIRPLGFICKDKRITLREEHPIVEAFQYPPDRARPMPYHYAFLRSIAPNYLRVPSKNEQFKTEMRLERHLRNYKKLHKKWDFFKEGANRVPLDQYGAASAGPTPTEELPPYEKRFGGEPGRGIPSWLVGERRIPNFSTVREFKIGDLFVGRVKRHAGVALVDAFQSGEEAQERIFALATDGRLIPADKLKIDEASPFHGIRLKGTQLSLPLGFAYRNKTGIYELKGDRLLRTAYAERRSVIDLENEERVFNGNRYIRSKDNHWYRVSDLRLASRKKSFPWFAQRSTKWIDLSIMEQVLVLYEGEVPVYITLVSTGRDWMGDPAKTLSTPTGTFRITRKHVTTTMDSSVADSEFELRDVPWVMYFKGGYALHAAYWHNDFGRPRSHGCVNLSPIDARYVFAWATPQVPNHWHGAYSGKAMGQGTLVHIHR
ncbi:MAG: L,D-transpeptidase [Polyangiaceae bacterium]|nr:L,D-transpeptidase [Polyangiaceae bacterium]